MVTWPYYFRLNVDRKRLIQYMYTICINCLPVIKTAHPSTQVAALCTNYRSRGDRLNCRRVVYFYNQRDTTAELNNCPNGLRTARSDSSRLKSTGLNNLASQLSSTVTGFFCRRIQLESTQVILECGHSYKSTPFIRTGWLGIMSYGVLF